MPDITMCMQSACPVRAKCYRHPESGTQPSDRRQSWASFGGYDETGCAHFWQNEPIRHAPGYKGAAPELP